VRLELERVTRRFGRQAAVDGLSLSLDSGSIGCLLGPSGCGKTTALRCIAGFERPDAGMIRAGDVVLDAPGTCVPAERRRIGMVFQDYALFPHLTVAENVGFGLRGVQAGERSRRVAELLELVGLSAESGRFPDELSGGQQQRVALARALAPQPHLVLLDEPFSSLDADVRERLAGELRTILKRAGATALLVTHDQHEAFAMADRVGVMREGQLEQWDTPWRLYHSPATRFVADFVGEGAFLRGRVVAPGRVDTALGILGGELTNSMAPGTDVELLLRPDDIAFDADSALRARVAGRLFRGTHFRYSVELPDGARLLASIPSHVDVGVGSDVGLRVDARHLVAFATTRGAADGAG